MTLLTMSRQVARVVASAAAAAALTVSAPAIAQAASGGTIAPPTTPHLPTVVNAPGTWSDEDDVRGPVAALGIAQRTSPTGISDERERLSVFAVSALDGHATWLRTPGFSLERWGFVGGVAVSPNGRWLGWVRTLRSRSGGGEARVAGWSVMDTTTGDIRRLDVPGFPWVRGTMNDLAFSGDSRYLLTSYVTPDQPRVSRSRDHQLVAWDVDSGKPTVVERPGHYWLPNLGSAPTTITWARGHRVFRFDPDTGEQTTVQLPEDVVEASWGPDDTSFAYIGGRTYNGRWQLHVGSTLQDAVHNVVDLPEDVVPGQLLGWRDSDHVVLGHYRPTVHVVDVNTGAVQAIDMAGYGDQVNAPSLAAALWAQPLAAPVEPRGTTDPRRPWRWTLGIGAAAGASVLFGRRIRRRLRSSGR